MKGPSPRGWFWITVVIGLTIFWYIIIWIMGC